MDAFLHGTRLSIKWHGDVYWFDRESGEIGLNGKIPFHVKRITIDDYEARQFMDDVDVLSSQFPIKNKANPEYTRRRQELIDFAEETLGPYMELAA